MPKFKSQRHEFLHEYLLFCSSNLSFLFPHPPPPLSTATHIQDDKLETPPKQMTVSLSKAVIENTCPSYKTEQHQQRTGGLKKMNQHLTDCKLCCLRTPLIYPGKIKIKKCFPFSYQRINFQVTHDGIAALLQEKRQ